MHNIKRIGKVFFFIIFIIITLFSCGYYLSLYIYPFNYAHRLANNTKLQAQLPNSKKQWLSQNISNYDIDVKIDAISAPGCTSSRYSSSVRNLHADVTLKVKDGVIVSVVKRKEELQIFGSRFLHCQYYSYYTILNMFDSVENAFRSKARPEVNLSFDSKYGFVSRYEYSLDWGSDEIITYSNFLVT